MDMEFHHTSHTDSWNPSSPRGDPFNPFEDIGGTDLPSPGSSGGVRLASRFREPSARTRVDWMETPEVHIFKADMPGINSDDIQVEVEDGRILKISGDLSEEHLGTADKWHQHERSHGHFLRRFRLPENANTEDVRARLENGVLKLTIPKISVT